MDPLESVGRPDPHDALRSTGRGGRSVARVLVLFAHPALEKSRCNVRLIAAAREVEDVTVHDLYEVYPSFDIDVPAEQRRIEEHDAIVFQHPLYWYGTPALLKEWQDLVLEHGWAYGSGGTALVGKTWLAAVTAGGSEETYRRDGLHGGTLRDFLAPLEGTARLCGMDPLPPFAVHATLALTPTEIDGHAADYARVLAALRDGAIDRDAAARLERINAALDAVIRTGEET